MAVQVVRVLRDDDSVRQIRLRDDSAPDRSAMIEPDSWVDFLRAVKNGDYDQHLPPREPRQIPCNICGNDDHNHPLGLNPDQWWEHFSFEYEDSRDHGGSKSGADDYAEREMDRRYGPCPSGPIRPFGPWLALVPTSYDLSWHSDVDVQMWVTDPRPSSVIDGARAEIAAAAVRT